MAFAFLQHALEHRVKSGLYRKQSCLTGDSQHIIQVNNQFYLNFASNDYLGLRQDERVLQSYVEGLSLFGAGSGASPLVTGHTAEHKRLCDIISTKLNKPATLLFSSGFAANQAICHALFPRKKRSSGENMPTASIICDKLMHASFIEGALTANTLFKRFNHNSPSHLQGRLANTDSDVLVATEGVFSMDGDVGNISAIQKVMNDKHWLLVDDAHAIGVIGEQGYGSADMPHINNKKIDIVMGTFGKAIGTAGAFISASQVFIDYLTNFSKHYIYSTAMPAAQARATITSLDIMETKGNREELHKRIDVFNRLCQQRGINTLTSHTAIHPIVLGSPDKVKLAQEKLQQLGIWVGAIRSPTVPVHSDRLRITLSATHAIKDIEALVDALSIVLNDISNSEAKKHNDNGSYNSMLKER